MIPRCSRLLACAIALAPSFAFAQIVLEDRTLEGHVGFTDDMSSAPGILLVPSSPRIQASSVGRPDVLNNSAPLFDDGLSPRRRAHEVVVEAFGGDYWLMASTRLDTTPQQTYVFGYAANTSGAPGHPNFDGAWMPVLQNVTPASPDPVPGVDLVEYATRVSLHFIEADPDRPGFYRPTTEEIGGGIEANPRLDPSDAAAPYAFAGGPSANGIYERLAQASGEISGAPPEASLWVRSSQQPPPRAGDPIRVQLFVLWSQRCRLVNPDCPDERASRIEASYFEGLTAKLGDFGGYVPGPEGENPGIFIPRDDSPIDLYVIVTPCMPGCPLPPAAIEGCANLIGETEILPPATPEGSRVEFDWFFGRAAQAPVLNAGEPPLAGQSPELFDVFDPAASEGNYRIERVQPGVDGEMTFTAHLDPMPDGRPWRQDFTGTRWPWTAPGSGETALGFDFCMVPGVYRGTIRLRDANNGAAPTGGLRALVEQSSAIIATGRPTGPGLAGDWRATRDLRFTPYDPDTGIAACSYENVFAASPAMPIAWTENELEHRFENPSLDPSRFMSGNVHVGFNQPLHAVTWDGNDFVAPAAGGRWPGPLMPGTDIAEREARVVPADFDLCFAKLRIQVRSTSVRFFDPRIDSGRGSFSDDMGTPDPSDDVAYGALLSSDPRRQWLGSPRTFEEAAREGEVNLFLPQGTWERIGGFITTVLDPLTHRLGTTDLPEIDVALGCGTACTVVGTPASRTPVATLCLDPIAPCNDPGVLAGSVPLHGTLYHQDPVIAGWWRINGGAPVPVDLAAAGITCVALPCSDAFSVVVADPGGAFHACGNDIELSFEDATGLVVSSVVKTFIDTTPPVFHVGGPGSPIFDCAAVLAACEGEPLAEPTALDDCSAIGDTDSPLVVSSDRPAVFPPGETLVTFTAVDGCGNTATCPVVVRLEAPGARSIECPPPLLIECAGPSVPRSDPRIQAWLDSASVTVLCGALPAIADDAPSDFPVGCAGGGITTVTFWAEGAGGERIECTSTVTVVDTTPPVLVVPAPILIECSGHGGVTLDDAALRDWLSSAQASDACSSPSVIHDAPALIPASCEPGLPTTVRFRAEDGCGNFAEGESSVTVVDSSGPSIDADAMSLVLWPAHHEYVVIDAQDARRWVRDGCGDVTLKFTGCASSQPEDNRGDRNAGDGGDGSTACDCAISPDGTKVAMRAERNGGCSKIGRTYTVMVDASDACGHEMLGLPLRACVPHDSGAKAGEPWPSTAAAPPADDLCLEGWINATYPAATGKRDARACGDGCGP